ncbi:MAG TPA: T9SS type A sorting domain-containing protein [Bacteroidia bacterium]|nr:T9SS type A sorting domain-containing protein [Bacteroidia bacterium]
MKRKIFYPVCFLFLLSDSFLKQCAAQTLTVSPPGPVDSWLNFQNLTASPSGAVAYEWFERSHYQWCAVPTPTGIDQGPVLDAPPTGIWFCVATWSNGSTSVSNDVSIRELGALISGGVRPDNSNIVCSTEGKDLYIFPHTNNNQSCTGMFWDSYQWQFNGVSIPAATNYFYHAIQGGYYSCIVSNTITPVSTDSLFTQINPAPSAGIIPTGTTTFCSGGNVTLNAPIAANRSYQWKKGANIIPGATLSSYTVTAGGNYRVTVTNIVTGCSKTTATPTVVTVNPVPPATITPQGPTTFCAGGSVLLKGNYGAGFTYQWKKGGNDIPGATSKNYTATIAGTYKIKVTNGYGCAKLSTGVTVTVPCRENESVKTGEEEGVFDVKVFPNPAHTEINIVLSQENNFEIEIINTLGEKLIKEQNQDRIDVSSFSSGVYFIKVICRDRMVTQKFIKQ